ncbi:MAG TPA: glycosyltransferase, partial [Anaerolineae bacterium]
MNQASFLVSIIITNYNYARFLTDAIDSALNQSYSNIEVIVVDDGSTDESRQIIASYDHRVIPVLKENGGQASALNAGFSHSRGDVVIFLDADDILWHDTVARVVAVFRDHPEIARVQYRTEVIDSSGNRMGIIVPPPYLPLPNADFRHDLLGLINCANWSPTGGNAFAAWTLRQILPMPESSFRICADYYLSRVNALLAPIRSLDEIGAYYRYHGENRFFRALIDLDHIRDHIVLARSAHEHIRRAAKSFGIDEYPSEADLLPDEIDLAQRLISLKLDRWRHPIPEDNLASLSWRGIKAAFQRSTLSLQMRAVHSLWFVAMLVVPGPYAHAVAQLFFPEQRGTLSR